LIGYVILARLVRSSRDVTKEAKMEDKTDDIRPQEASVVKIEDMNLEETQLAEQLYNNAGLDPVVKAGLKDYNERLQLEDKFINKVFGVRGSDIKGFGDAVAKRVALATYTLLNRQYGGKVGDLRSYIMTLEEERDRANMRYDELMGRVVGILGDEYKDLRSDSKEFMERLTTVLGEDLKESKIDKKELAEKLADIDGLRSRITGLEKENEDLKSKHESEINSIQDEHMEEVKDLKSQIDELDSRIKGLESEQTTLTNDLSQLSEDYNKLKTDLVKLAEETPNEEIGKGKSDELYNLLIKDAKIPDTVIKGVGKFIDFKKYLGISVDRGIQEVCQRIKDILSQTREC
jgi:DNA repair exonuclease SbcCD ATPase subunit